MLKICIVGVYFGKFNEYFPLFLKSCGYNKTVDFLFFTDNEYSENIPENVKFVKTTFNDIKVKIQSFFYFQICLDKPYKVCDFRPFYGVLFKDYLIGYDYWGHCDFDMLFGDLRYFFDKYDLGKYDRFLNHGHLCLYKNNEEINNRYKLPVTPDYKYVFSHEGSFFFDELKGMNIIYSSYKFSNFIQNIYADISPMYKRLILDPFAVFLTPNFRHQIFYYDKGKVFYTYKKGKHYNKFEFIYIHIQKRKNLFIHFDKDVDEFYITNTGFYEKQGEPNLKIIKKYNNKSFADFKKEMKFNRKNYIRKVSLILKKLSLNKFSNKE